MADARTIVITGCSTGFGRVTALALARQAWRVWATVRKEADAASLRDEASTLAPPGALMPVVCDITVAAQVSRLQQTVAAATPRLDALVNNAGTAYPGPLELLPLDDLRAQFEVNVIGHLAVTQALLPLLKAARGTILNVSSVGGRLALPGNGAYHLSKWALEAMSDVLRVELAPFGVKVVVLEPGASPTAIWQTSRQRATQARAGLDPGRYGPLLDVLGRYAERSRARGFPPERFATAVVSLLKRRRPPSRYAFPLSARLVIALRQLMPDRVWDQAVRWALRW